MGVGVQLRVCVCVCSRASVYILIAIPLVLIRQRYTDTTVGLSDLSHEISKHMQKFNTSAKKLNKTLKKYCGGNAPEHAG